MSTPALITLHVQCPGCLSQAFLGCSCPDGHVANVGRHHPECAMGNPDAAVACDPASTHPSCCHHDHDHAAMANSCAGQHDGAACPHPEGECRLWHNATADARHPLYPGGHPLLGPDHGPGDPVPPCPGGHCAKGTDGCTVCRPLVLTMPGASPTVITPVVR